MASLQNLPARVCLTVAAVLIHDGKVLLVKHKKLGIWLAPGGHVEPNELPHQAAEREFWEETGIKVKAVDVGHTLPSQDSEYVPNPFLSNLHWISEKRYQDRVAAGKAPATDPSSRDCEQHFCSIYMMKPAQADLTPHQNLEESDAIKWFTQAALKALELTPDIRSELEYAFTLK